VTVSLAGLRVLAPVNAHRSAIADALAQAGAQVCRVEVIAVAATSKPADLAAAIRSWHEGAYDYLTVTSPSGAAALAAAAREHNIDLAHGTHGFRHTQVAAVGAATASALAGVGLHATIVPDGAADATALVDVFPTGHGRVLAPLGNLASSTLADGLRAKGWSVDVVEAYRTVDGPPLDPDLPRELASGRFDAVVITSGSVATRLCRELPLAQSAAAVVAIGNPSATRARELGLNVAAIAAEPTPDGVVNAVYDATRKDRS